MLIIQQRGVIIKRKIGLLLFVLIISTSIVWAADNETVTEDNSIQQLSTHSDEKIINSDKTRIDTNATTSNSNSVINNSKDISKDVSDSNIKAQSNHRTKISVSDRTGYITTNVQLIATVADKETNTYANGGIVVFKLNGITVGNATLSNGKAYYNYNSKDLSAKTYSISAVYSGYGIYASSDTTSNGTLKLMALPTKIAVTNVSSYSTITTLKATIVDKYNNQYMKNGTVLFKINGVSIGTAQIVNGKASIAYDATDLYADKYDISVVYGGNKLYSEYRAYGTLTVKVKSSFTFNEVREAAVYVRNFYENNQIINHVYIGTSKLHIQEYLYLVAHAINNIDKSKTSSSIAYKSIKAPSKQTDEIKKGTYYPSEMISIVTRLISYMDANGVAPTYVTTSAGKLGYYNVIYCLSKILDVSTSSYLVESCVVYPWSTLHPSNPTARHIYLTTDNIYNTKTDKAFLESIKAKFVAKGYKVTIVGIGPNTHNVNIWAKSMPINAVQVSIFGGSDAGVFYDISTRSFMRTKSNRILYMVFDPNTARDFRNHTWLERAWDDNYSPSSFKGLAYPAEYLNSHGYEFLFSRNVDTIVNSVIKYIS